MIWIQLTPYIIRNYIFWCKFGELGTVLASIIVERKTLEAQNDKEE